MTDIISSYCDDRLNHSRKQLSLHTFIGFISEAVAVHRQRQALGSLPPERLEDIGVSRAEAQQEARRAFWDLPKKR